MRDVRSSALIITQYYRPEMLGSGPFCADLAEWLAQRGWHVTVMAGPPHYPDANMFHAERARGVRREMINGVTVERVGSRIAARGSAASRVAAEFSFFVAGLRALLSGRVRRAPLVISLCPSILSVALGALARVRRGRHVALVHDIQSGLAKGLHMVDAPGLVGAMRLIERLALNRPDLVAVLTPEMADQLRLIGVKRSIELLPIWVDLDRFAPIVQNGGGPIRILYSGNLGRKQGLNQIIDLSAELQRSRPELRIVVRGRGNQADALRADIETRALRNIRIEEPLPHEALLRGLAEADIHLVPQAPDAAAFALPSKIFNIMAAGRPFVATARPGSPLWRIREVSGAFLCVQPNNPRAFADAVLRLADDPMLRAELGERGRKFVARHNARTKVLGDFEARIDALCVQ